ncbi:aldo/keto reductase [Bacillus sp. V2I10]|uniref:aldo/keto reductase n=1 Tax=Bacillus sp. V2I10 TaxID=3042276 RepID=UPI0027868293|nr:aldo/keto reductase [Bacillus sp. V2I10]MDQ0858527.1 aryl-alcohol dehydrogenase-like predicted oxidoreductase [Bacillus sp. V2I10]
MKKRQLGTSDLFVSELGLGCMSLGTDKEQAESIIDAALYEGINYFDTADLYDFGLNEEFVGDALKKRRQDLILATKAGNRWNENKDGWTWDPSKAYIKEAVKHSLKRLQTDYIDLYQLHGGTIEDNIDETIEAFEDLKKEGVIRYYGISSIRPNVIKQYLEKSSIVSVMMQYSLLDRRPEEWFSLLNDQNVSVIGRGPLAKGLLTDKWESKLSEKGYLSYSEDELLHLLPSIDAETDLTLTETAVQYSLKQAVVGSIIPGASKIEQVQANCRALNARPLSGEEYIALQALTKFEKYEQHRS